MSNIYGNEFRKDLIYTSDIIDLVDLSKDQTFEDASVRTAIFNLNNVKNNNLLKLHKVEETKQIEFISTLNQEALLNHCDNWFKLFINTNIEIISIFNKLKSKTKILNNYFQVSQKFIFHIEDLI